jgi:O-antigen ligase
MMDDLYRRFVVNNYLINAVKSQKSPEQKIAASFTIAIAISISAIGSLASALFIIVCIIGLVNAIRGYGTKPYLAKHDYIIVIPALAYFAVNALSLLNSPFELKDLESLVGPSLFLMFYFAVRCYRDLEMEKQFELFLRAAPYGSIFMLIWIIDFTFFHPGRMDGGSGNPIPFAMTCAMMLSISALNAIRLPNWERLFNSIAAILFFLALIRSETRSMYLALGPLLLILAVYGCYQNQRKIKFLAIGLIIVAAVTMLATNNVFNHKLFSLVKLTQEVYEKGTHTLNDGVSFERSISYRLQMIQKSLCLIYERPLTGYGIDERRAILVKEKPAEKEHPWEICQENSPSFQFTHFHNGFLTATVDAGIIGLVVVSILWLSPLLFGLREKNDCIKATKLSYSAAIVSIYGLAGLTNILFGHDIVDSMFLFCCCYLLIEQPRNSIDAMPVK